jgi:hypothetical protein
MKLMKLEPTSAVMSRPLLEKMKFQMLSGTIPRAPTDIRPTKSRIAWRRSAFSSRFFE